MLCNGLSAVREAERDGAGALSINAGIPFHNEALIAQLRLTSAKAFARDLGILRAINQKVLRALPEELEHTELWIATTDWKAYYRNLLKPVSEWWQQILFRLTASSKTSQPDSGHDHPVIDSESCMCAAECVPRSPPLIDPPRPGARGAALPPATHPARRSS